ncbi:MAG: peptidase MA family metallohydrolase [Candidatus Omnitrophota bacterium]|nr:peptidase MA family metallohydrolase [Candidatus Omnitrophota bacterium]
MKPVLQIVIAWLLLMAPVWAADQQGEKREEKDWPVLIAQLRQEVQRRPGLAHPREQLAIAYNNYGVSLSDVGQWEPAIAQLREAIRMDPQNQQYRQNLANVFINQAQKLHENHQDNEALSVIAQALELHPSSAGAHQLLGEIEYGRQQLKEAKVAWERALALDPANTVLAERLAQLANELPVESKFDKLSQAYFDLRYEDLFERPAGFDIRDVLLQARRDVGSDFAYWPKYKIVVLIYSNERFRSLRQETPEWIGGLYDGKIRVPLPGIAFGAARVREILFHEYTHALVHDLTKNRCPQWFNEGLATYEGMKHGVPRIDQLAKAASAQRLVVWDQLNDQFAWGLPTDQVELGYQQSHSVVQYLVERYGFWRIRRLLKTLLDGATFEDALVQEFRVKSARLEADWRKWLLERVSVVH